MQEMKDKQQYSARRRLRFTGKRLCETDEDGNKHRPAVAEPFGSKYSYTDESNGERYQRQTKKRCLKRS